MIDLADCGACLGRARKHSTEFASLLHSREGRTLWNTTSVRDQTTGEYVSHLKFDRELLTLAKPVLADAANNIVSALDHVLAALARSHGHKRLDGLYFPIQLTPEKFSLEMRKPRKQRPSYMSVRGEEECGKLEQVHHRLHFSLPSLCAVKEISNSGKHWRLYAIGSEVMGITINLEAGCQMHINVPDNAFLDSDEFEFYGGPLPLMRTVYLGLRDTIPDMSEGRHSFPSSALDNAIRFAEEIISAV